MAVDQIARMMALDAAQQGGGGGGTDNYNDLTNRPKINNVTLTGNKTTSDLGIVENVQANWNETDSTAPSYIQNKPNIPSSVVVDTTYDGTSENAQAGTAVAQAISTKVDKVDGKGLSENDFTNADKAKLDGIETGAEANVQADWSQSDSTADDYIKNKPTIPTVDQTYNAQSANPQSGTAVAQAVQDSGSEYSARVMNLEAAYGDPDYLEGLGYWGLVYHTKEYAESGSALSTLRNVTITPGTIILLKWDSADGRGYKDLTYMFSRIGMARYAPDYPVDSAGWSVRIVRYETDSQYTNPQPLPDDFDAVIYTSSIAYGSSESYSHSIIKAPPMKPGKYYYYAIEFLNDNESASFTCSFNQKVIAYFLQEPSNQPIMYDGVTRQQFIMPKGIKSTDYATQTTGGTIKAWTTTDGSDTILHLATQ